MTLTEAKNLKPYDYIHHVEKKNADGTPMRARITSVKTWKTRPNEVRIRCKHGMYDYAEFNEREINQINVGYGL